MPKSKIKPKHKQMKKNSKSRKPASGRSLLIAGKSFSRRSAFIFAGVFGLIGAIVLIKSFAGTPQPFSFTKDQNNNIQHPVEQQSPDFFFGDKTNPSSWVGNPTRYAANPCLWDVDDHIAFTGFGKLAPGVSVKGTLCVVADQYDNFGGDDHMLLVKATNASPDVTVSLSNDQGFSTTLTPVKVGRSYEWKTCKVDHTPGPYATIDGSNGGTGTFVRYTVTVTNTSRQTRNPYVRLYHPLVGTPEWFTEHNAGCV